MSSIKLLSELPAGTEAEIRGLNSASKDAHRLREMGLVPGTKIKLVRWAPMGDPLEVKVRGYHLSLRKKEAEHVEVILPGP